MVSGIKTETANRINDYENYMKDSLARIKRAAEPILTQTKRAMPTQTFQARKNHIETQFNKADLPKGKGGRK
ncbi:hypothetical protein TVAG_182540 [Trichomonas vaginalis G3]|uniref:Uncharacterized protein n=2 Tax=Trichomonas vaginalis (strain ATCC PRA-98 / G3) TaxID=412133 RepID=A2D8Z2_TRIV3|nr:hypothetical protein TVAG_182540 [Trichomonas vaginalis G3]|eukprot:XP_001584004.1 hypothetical protein [Trichomonas vaginalis G3]